MIYPGVEVHGRVEFGMGVDWCEPGEANGTGSKITVGDHCDLAAFVVLNCADSHKRCIGLNDEIERGPITLENNVFVGSHSFIGANVHIGHHSVIAAGTIIRKPLKCPPYSLVYGNPAKVSPRRYEGRSK